MKSISALILSFAFITIVHAQVISYEDFKAVIPYIEKEDFKTAFTKTNELLNSTQNDSSNLRGIITYMNIYSAAGLVSIGEMTHDKFLKAANKYIGQWIVMSAHPCIDSTKQGFNSLIFTIKDGETIGAVTSSDKTKTHILCFEYFKYAEPINIPDLVGKNVRCGGVLESVEINPNKSTIWISRLHISNAFAKTMTAK